MANTKNIEYMKELQTIAHKNASYLHKKLDNQGAESSGWNDKTISDLQTVYQKIDRFTKEDLKKDEPTGIIY